MAKRSDTFAEYVKYCEKMERKHLTKQNFFRSMGTKGWNATLVAGIFKYRGMALKADNPNNWPVLPEKEDPYVGADEEEHGRAV